MNSWKISIRNIWGNFRMRLRKNCRVMGRYYSNKSWRNQRRSSWMISWRNPTEGTPGGISHGILGLTLSEFRKEPLKVFLKSNRISFEITFIGFTRNPKKKVSWKSSRRNSLEELLGEPYRESQLEFLEKFWTESWIEFLNDSWKKSWKIPGEITEWIAEWISRKISGAIPQEISVEYPEGYPRELLVKSKKNALEETLEDLLEEPYQKLLQASQKALPKDSQKE